MGRLLKTTLNFTLHAYVRLVYFTQLSSGIGTKDLKKLLCTYKIAMYEIGSHCSFPYYPIIAFALTMIYFKLFFQDFLWKRSEYSIGCICDRTIPKSVCMTFYLIYVPLNQLIFDPTAFQKKKVNKEIYRNWGRPLFRPLSYIISRHK